ncbi:MAG: site-specific integrase [Planctomycetaceae bacterium]|nr:site-specific integrase [Planctomycetaceae bacterium]
MGEGSIFKSGNKWRYEYKIGKNAEGKSIYKRLTFDKKADAIAAKKQVIIRQSESPNVEASRMTVAGYLTGWLKHIKEEKAANTYNSYELSVRLHIKPRIGGILIQELNGLHIEAMLREIKVGTRTKQNAYTVLSAALKRAVRLKLIPFNPCGQVDKPTHKKAEINPFSEDEVKQILESVADHRIGVAFWLGFTTGIRQGELLGLRWSDVDFARSEILLTRQAIDNRGKPYLDRLKTANSRRVLHLTAGCLKSLQVRQSTAMKEGLAGCEFVVPTGAGTIFGKSNFDRQVWKRVLKSCDLELRGFHHTRHTFATINLGAGVPVRDVSEALGHASASFTLQTYAHFIRDRDSLTSAEMKRIFG